MPNYAVGDIQGCFDELEEGLELINFNNKKDFLWITGDLINRGPDSLRVLKYILSIKEAVHIVLGNHDLHLLNCFFNKKKLRKEDTFKSIFDDKNVLQMMNFLLQQDFVFSKKIFSDNGILKVGMVHAGIPKMMSLKQAETLSKLNCLKLKKNPKMLSKIKMISLSFDPFYDTPEIMRLYGKDLSYVKADWGFLTTKSLANLEPILESYDQPVIRKYNDDGSYAGVESHLLRVFLIDDKKLIRNVFTNPITL